MRDSTFTISNIKFINTEIIEDFTIDTTIFFQLKGFSQIYLDGDIHNMKKGNLMIINRNKNYSMKNTNNSDNVLISLEIDNGYFISQYDDFRTSYFELFPCEETAGKSNYIDKLRTEISKLLINYITPSNFKKINLNISINKIILSLISYFRKESDIQKHLLGNEKIIEVLQYLDNNYEKKITIENLAKNYFMSASTLSKTFKEETGVLFSKYLNDLRSTKSLKDLLFTSLSVEEIAYKNGFNNSRTYRRAFKDTFNDTPSDYRRKKNNKSTIDNSVYLDDIFDKSSDIFQTIYSYINVPKKTSKIDYIVENNKKLIIDSNIDRNQFQPNMIIHIGSLKSLLEKDAFDEFKTTNNDIGINYVGFSKLYEYYPSTYFTVNIEDKFNFSDIAKFDYILNYLHENSIGILYQIHLKDIYLNKKKYYWQLIDLLKFIKNMYGEKSLKNFRVNFISDKDFIEINKNLYLFYSDEIKSISKNIETGISIPFKYPEYSFYNNKDEEIFLKEIIPKCNFLSYTSDPNNIYDYNKDEILDMDFFNEFVFKEVSKIKNIIRKWNVSIPLVLSEWNTLTGESQDVNGTFFRAGIILKEILKLDLLVESYGFWLNTGLYGNYKLDKENNFNSLELFYNYSGKKPVYNVLLIASRLKGNVKFLGEECMLLQDGENYQLLLWNPNYFNPKLSSEIKFLESKAIIYNIDIPYIENGNYQVKRFDLSRYQGAIYYVFQNFKSKISIDLETRDYISNASKPSLSVFDVIIEDGFKYSVTLDTNAIVLLEFKPFQL